MTQATLLHPTIRPVSGHGALPMLEVVNDQAAALISLYGGQVLSFCPAGEEDLLFLSSKSHFEQGLAIRGGVPLCWPWFGPHPSDSSQPSHGFARLANWEVSSSEATCTGATRLVLELPENEPRRALWPHPLRLRLTVEIGRELFIALETENGADEPLHHSAALHSYFRLGEAEHVQITGLDDTFYIDSLAGGISLLQRGRLQVNEEINRIYLDSGNTCIIHDPMLERQIVVKKRGSHSTVVWNPWVERSRSLVDLGDEEYRHMVCIEAANVHHDAVELAPGARHILATEISLIR